MALDRELDILIQGTSLTRAGAREAMDAIFSGSQPPTQIAAFLIALRMKGETAEELAGFTDSMRAVMLPVASSARPLIDTCGTGGDGLGTFNISTTVALVAAGAGATVAKHGNRSISSQSGSADVLEALGVKVGLKPAESERCLAEVGIAFLFAPEHHPAMRHVQPIRRELKVRTVFNFLGPLSNPAQAPHQLIGVSSIEMARRMAAALALLGTERALVVHGADGLDEIALAGPSQLLSVHLGQVSEHTIHPEDFGLQTAPLAAIAGGDVSHNAALTRAVLAGEPGSRRDIVLLNAAAALTVCGLAPDYASGVRLAAQSIDSGAAHQKLEALARFTQAV